MATTVRSSAARVLLAVALLLCVAAALTAGAEGAKPKQPTAKYISYTAKPNNDCIKQVPAPAYCGCGKSTIFGRCPVGWRRPNPPRDVSQMTVAAADHAP